MKKGIKKSMALILALIILISGLPINSIAAVEKPNWDKESSELDGKLNYWPLEENQTLNTITDADVSVPILEMKYQGQSGAYAHFTSRLSGYGHPWDYNLMLRADARLEDKLDMTKSFFERDKQKYYLFQEVTDNKILARANLKDIFEKNYDASKPTIVDFYLYVGEEKLEDDYIIQARFYKGSVGKESILNFRTLTRLHPALQDKDPYKFYTSTYPMSNTRNDENMNFGIENKDIPWTDGKDQVIGVNSFFQIDNEKNKLRVFYVWRGRQGANNNDFSKTLMSDGKYYNIGFRIAFPNEFYDVLRPVDGLALTNISPRDERNINYVGRYTQIGQAGHTFTDTGYAGKSTNSDELSLRGLVGIKGEDDFTGGTNSNKSNDYPEGAFNQRILTTNKLERGNHGDFTSIDVVSTGFNESATSNSYKANRDGRHISIVSRAGSPVANVFEFNIDPQKFKEKFYDEDGNYNNKLVFRNSFVFNEKGTDNIIELDKSSSYAAGTGEHTQYLPMVDEIFTNSTAPITGYTLYPDSRAHYLISNKDKEISGFVNTSKYSSLINFKEKEYNAYKFSLNRPEDAEIIKDMPIEFMAEEKGKFPSKSVVEQVQTMVKFDLNGQKSKIDGLNHIEKILPLNKEFSISLDEKENPNYKPSGFAKIEHDKNIDKDKIEGGDNLKIDQENPIVSVTQELPNADAVERKVINYKDHNNENYDVNSDDKIRQKKETDALIKRQFPIGDEINLPNFSKLIGWTTVKLEDKKDSDGNIIKTAQEQFYDLKDKKDSDGKSISYLRDIEDWKKVDESNENMIFDELSPVDKERTVYAVYGGPQVVLHSGIKGKDGKEITVIIPISQADIDKTPDKMIGIDQEEIDRRIKTDIIKKIPKAPYSKEDKSGADDILSEFAKEGETFIGWTIKEDQAGFVAGNNNERISELDRGQDKDDNNLIKKTEWYSYIRDNPKEAYLPNGFNLGISAKDYGEDGKLLLEKNGGEKTLSSIEEFLIKGRENIHLYAVYRPYFNIKVKAQYNEFKAPDLENDPKHEWGSLVDGVVEEKQRPLQIGLLSRTAVTGYDVPTVDASANYYPIGGSEKLKTWDSKKPGDLSWTEPGFDILGRRKSFVALVVPEDKEQTYEDFAKPFSGESWSQMGISTFTKNAGESLDPNTPKNLYYDDVALRDPYGKPLAKLQNFKFTRKNQDGNEEIDAFTSATARAPIKNNDTNQNLNKDDILGYDIVMTNLIQQLPAPVFERVRAKDEIVKLEWGNTVDFDSIEKINIYTFDYEDTSKPVTLKLTKKSDGIFSTDSGQKLIGEVKEYTNQDGKKVYRLEIKGLHLNDLADTDIGAKYFQAEDVESQIGKTRIIGEKLSAEVRFMNQVAKKDKDDNAKIKFTVPEKVLDKVGPGSIYIAEKWDPSYENEYGSKGAWLKVGEKILEDKDLINNKFEGNEYEIDLYEYEGTSNEPGYIEVIDEETKEVVDRYYKVKDADIIRIVSKETNKDEDEIDVDGNVTKLGYSKPGYSAGRKPIVDDVLKIVTGYEFSDKYLQDDEKPGSNYVKLDLEGPKGNIEAKDEKFRRFINIEGQLDEIPNDQKVILEINTSGLGQGSETNEAYEFESKKELIQYYNQLPREEEMPQMWIHATDYLGNKSLIDVTYNKSYICRVFIRDYRTGRKSVNVSSDKDNTIVTVTIYNRNVELAKGTAVVEKAGEFVELKLLDIDGNPYRIRKGNRINIIGEIPKGDEASNFNPYISNSFDIFAK